jgi:hypothetical protein
MSCEIEKIDSFTQTKLCPKITFDTVSLNQVNQHPIRTAILPQTRAGFSALREVIPEKGK